MKKSAFIIGIFVILLEVFIFNFSSLKSMFYDEIKININDIKLNAMTKSTSKEAYRLGNEDNYFIINTNGKVNNVYLDIDILRSNSVVVSIKNTDDANGNYGNGSNDIYSHEIVRNFEKSKYIDCYYLGNTHSIKVSLDGDRSTYLNINNIVLNKRMPLFINYLRMIILFLIVFIPYNYKVFRNLIDKNYKYVLGFVILIFCIFVVILYKEISYVYIDYDSYTTYYKDALMNGKFDLDIDEIDVTEIEKIDDIYDATERYNLSKKIFDTSYYNGKFYMYFGFLPALLMGITGMSLCTITCLFSILGVVFSILLIDLLIDRYCKNVSPGIKLLFIIFFLFNCRLFSLIAHTRYHELLVISGYSLCVTGIYALLKFTSSNKKLYLLLGSLFLSVSLMCRPNMLIISLLGFLFVYKKINKNNCLYYFLPYIIVIIILFYINYIRFGNIFEFGLSYQLSIVDNNYSKMNIMSIINGVFINLFRVPIIDGMFPYVHNSLAIIPFNGFYYNNAIGNGIIVMSVLGIIIPFMNKKIDRENKRLFFICVICGLSLLLLSNMVGGSIKRFTLEYTWLFLIPIIIHSIKCFKNNKNVLFILILISCLINFLVIFDTDKEDLKLKMDNNLYYYLKYF